MGITCITYTEGLIFIAQISLDSEQTPDGTPPRKIDSLYLTPPKYDGNDDTKII